MVPLKRTGFRSQRHIDAFASHGVHYLSDNLHNAKVATGITMQYSLHVVDPLAGNSSDGQQQRQRQEQFRQDDDNVERLVMIMGFVQAKEAWSVMLDFLVAKGLDSKKRLEVLTFDNRGVGRSDAPWGRYSTSQMAQDTFALMDHVGWTKAHVVGISMGGMIAMEMASRMPERICSLALIVTSRGYYFPELKNLPVLLKVFTCTTLESVIPQALKILHIDSFLTSTMEDREEKLEDVLVRIHIESLHSEQACAPTVPGWIGQNLAIFSHRVSDERLHEIRDRGFPILLIGGQHDKIIPPRDMDELYQVLKADHVRHVIYPDAGHGCFVQYCEEVMDEIRHHILNCGETTHSKHVVEDVVGDVQEEKEEVEIAVDAGPPPQQKAPRTPTKELSPATMLEAEELREQLAADGVNVVTAPVCA